MKERGGHKIWPSGELMFRRLKPTQSGPYETAANDPYCWQITPKAVIGLTKCEFWPKTFQHCLTSRLDRTSCAPRLALTRAASMAQL